MLRVTGLNAYYGESRVLHHLDMVVPQGDIVCLVGRNGVGKSTTLKSIMGLVKTPHGSIMLDGQEIQRLRTFDRTRAGIGYVPQGREIFSSMTVAENLALGLQPLGGRGKVPDYLYEIFPSIAKFAKRRGGDLSGGQQQQLAIARALVAEPKLLILDEPTEGIQPSIIEDIGEAIRKVNKWKGITVLIVEQYLDFVLGISDSLYVMDKGSIVMHGRTAEVDAAQVQRTITEGASATGAA